MTAQPYPGTLNVAPLGRSGKYLSEQKEKKGKEKKIVKLKQKESISMF